MGGAPCGNCEGEPQKVDLHYDPCEVVGRSGDGRPVAGFQLFVPRLGRQSEWSALIISAARSPMTAHGAIVLPTVTRGMIEASATRRLSNPYTLSAPSTTDKRSMDPILAVPQGCQCVVAASRIKCSSSGP